MHGYGAERRASGSGVSSRERAGCSRVHDENDRRSCRRRDDPISWEKSLAPRLTFQRRGREAELIVKFSEFPPCEVEHWRRVLDAVIVEAASAPEHEAALAFEDQTGCVPATPPLPKRGLHRRVNKHVPDRRH
jgi:hypothetical protein